LPGIRQQIWSLESWKPERFNQFYTIGERDDSSFCNVSAYGLDKLGQKHDEVKGKKMII